MKFMWYNIRCCNGILYCAT